MRRVALSVVVAGSALLSGCLGCGEGTHLVGETCVLDVTSPEAIAAICADGPRGDLAWDLTFERRDVECDWGEGDNGSAQRGEITAKAQQTLPLEVDANKLPCMSEFNFEPDGFQQVVGYGDHMFMLFSDVVILSSSRDLANSLAKEELLSIWDWDAIKGSDYERDTEAWCAGQGEGLGSCLVPESGEKGLFLAFDPIMASELVWRAEENGDYSFTLITVGDDDDDDCTNSRLRLGVDGAGAKVQ